MLKKTLSFFIMMSILLLSLNVNTVNAQSEDYDSKYIKVGIQRNVPSKSSMKLVGEGFSLVTDNGSISELLKVSNTEVVAKFKNFSYHIELSQSFNSYDNALRKSSELKASGVDSYVAYQNGFKVFIGEFANEEAAKSALSKISFLNSENSHILKNETLTSIESNKGEKIISFDKNQNIYIKSLGETTKVETKIYRGYMGFVHDKAKLLVVNYVKIGDYLRGVVPREMQASWNIEALKAQAVTARSYALRNLGKHKNLGYDLCDSDNCQVYDGIEREHPNSDKAVQDTRSKVLKYNGEIAQTFYYSCSGGSTANNEDAWGGTPIPYLRAKVDPYSINTPQSNWTYTISKTEAAKKLKANSLDVGQIISVETVRDNIGGRVVELKVTGTSGTKVVLREKVRAIFGYSSVKSTNYRIEGTQDSPQKPTEPTVPLPATPNYAYVISEDGTSTKKISLNNLNVVTSQGVAQIDNKNQKIIISNGSEALINDIPKTPVQKPVPPVSNTIVTGNNIVFKGNGWGHGVGMSQYGALNMAKAGYSYKDILEFYFTGATVE